MKPLKLTMQAFGSYGRKTEIDFNEPNQNIFLITGDTGAGKTTIFDAMSFALYGEASSINNKKNGKELQSQFVDQSIEPFVELCFQEGGCEYTVRRIPRHQRARKRGAGIVDVSEAFSLTMPNGSEYPAKEAENKVKEIVGLTKEQFMQVAMIAQGEFMELLRANSNTKKEIFRKLFGTELYNRIQEEFERRCQGKQAEVARLVALCRQSAGRIQTPEDEQWQPLRQLARSISTVKDGKDPLKTFSITEMEETVRRLEQLVDQLTSEEKALKDRQEEAVRASQAAAAGLAAGQSIIKAFDQQAEAEQRLAELAGRQAEMAEQRTLAAKIMDACEVQDAWKLWDKAAKALQALETDLDHQQKALPSLAEAAKAAELEKQRAEQEAWEHRTQLTRVEESVKQALLLFDNLAAAQIERKKAEANEAAAQSGAKKAFDELAALENSEAQWRKTAADLAQIPVSLAECIHREEAAGKLRQEIDAVHKVEKSIAAQAAIAKKTEKMYLAAQENWRVQNTEYQQAQLAFLNAQAGLIAQELRPGKPCPVCGSLEHPSPCVLAAEHCELTREAIDKLRVRSEQRQKEMTDCSVEAGKANEALKNLQMRGREDMTALRQHMAQQISDLPEAWTIESAQEVLNEWQQHIGTELTQLKKQQKLLDEVQKSLADVEQTREVLRQQYESKRRQAEEASKALAAAETNVNALTEQKQFDSPDEAKAALKAARDVQQEKDAKQADARTAAQKTAEQRNRASNLIEDYAQKQPMLAAEEQQANEKYRGKLAEKQLAENAWQAVANAYDRSDAEAMRKKQSVYDSECAAAQQQKMTALKLIGSQIKPDLAALQASLTEAQRRQQILQDAWQKLNAMLGCDRDILNQLRPQMEERAKAIRTYSQMNGLYQRLAGKLSGKRMDIETFAQRYYLKHILHAANKRFIDMTGGQFELRLRDIDQAGEGKNQGLDLDIYSFVTRKTREIRTLSGGESFMAALSLALGMADQIQESSSAVHLDMMFIDEGFGSLDDHARSQAVKVLKALAGGSRLIGIISHVSELKQEIDDQLIVTKGDDGSHIRWQHS